MMIVNSFRKLSVSVVLFAALTGLTACGEIRLADDPTSEPLSSVQSDDLTTEPATSDVAVETPEVDPPVAMTDKMSMLSKYSHLDPKRLVRSKLLEDALLYFDKNLTKFPNRNYITIIDFAKKSTLARFYVIDMQTGEVQAIHTAHGKSSDLNHDGFADSFSNVNGSNQSSVGFYKSAETYEGSHGLSMRLDGLSSTNSRARERAIVVHGADYVQEASVIQGRSWGCPALSMSLYSSVIKKLKGGSLMYAMN